MDDYGGVECEVCREALSARIDGEREPVASEQVDRHLAECVDCAHWYAAAAAATRRLRVRTVTEASDSAAAEIGHELAAAILAQAPAQRTRWWLRWSRPTPAPVDEPVTPPPGARRGRRAHHLRAS